jgi:hypothetical protein
MGASDSKARKDFEIVKAYIDTTKTIVQLSSAGLVLPLTLKTAFSEISSNSGSLGGGGLVFIVLSWLCFLVAIGAGSLYPYVAVKSVEKELFPEETFVPDWLKALVNDPGNVYGVMLIAFFGGAFFVVFYSSSLIFVSAS